MAKPSKESFLKMIDADPDNDEPRLVYADYLMEKSDPRGEFISIQCAMEKAKAENDKMEVIWCKIIEEELWNKYWRKFVQEDVFDFLAGSQRKRLELDDPKPWNFIYRRGFLFGLDLREKNIGDVGVEVFRNSLAFRNLRKLILSSNKISSLGAELLSNSTVLGNLRELWLDHNSIEATGIKLLAKSETFKNLEIIDLYQNNIGSSGAKAIARSATFGNLKELWINDNNIGKTGVVALANSEMLKKLKELHVESNNLSETGYEALKSLEKKRGVKVVI